MSVTVRTQAELDAERQAGEPLIIIDAPAGVRITLTDTGSSIVVARGSSSVVARDSSRVEARGSSRVVARDSSRVVARDSSRVEAWDSSRVKAGRYTTVWLRSRSATLAAEGVVIDLTDADPTWGGPVEAVQA